MSGRVIDSDGLPVIGAVVMTADNEATTTDEKGEWSLQVRNSEGTLEFSCLGYKTLSEEIAGRRVVDVTMQPDNVMLEETVVVGYGVQKKVNLTGSVSSIDFSDLADNRTIVSTSSALAGLAAGLVYSLIEKKNKTAATIAAAIVCPVVNTGVFLIGCSLFFMDTVRQWAEGAGFGSSVGTYMIVGLVGLNFVFELVINIVLSPVIVKLVRLGKKESK